MKAKGTLRRQLSSIKPVLDDLRVKKQQMIKEFAETESQIIRICAEISGNNQFITNAQPQVDEQDLTVRRLAERKSHLEELQNEKVIHLVGHLQEFVFVKIRIDVVKFLLLCRSSVCRKLTAIFVLYMNYRWCFLLILEQ